MYNIPAYIPLVFAITTLATVLLLVGALGKFRMITLCILVLWVGIQSFISQSGFYNITNTLPPRFLLLIGPPMLTILLLFVTPSGKLYLDHLDVKTLTLLHTVRIPVELVLYWLFLQKMVPELMTFEGRNFDIISGLSAPIVFLLGYQMKYFNRRLLIVWNFICLGLLFNIVGSAVLSVATPFQKFAFDQPNIAVLHFPFVWLPCLIVPVVLLAHLVCLRQLLSKK